MGYLIRGRIPAEDKNPINRFLYRTLSPVAGGCAAPSENGVIRCGCDPRRDALAHEPARGRVHAPLDEGDLLYMPSALPGLSAGKAAELLQQTDRLIKTVPEVASVFGKAGRAETATDPAPLEMFRNYHPVEAARAMAPGNDAGKTRR